MAIAASRYTGMPIHQYPELAGRMCSKCGERVSLPYHRYCRKCMNEYARTWRRATTIPKKGPINAEQMNALARDYALALTRAGLLPTAPCDSCKSWSHSVPVIIDPLKPAEVVWRCTECLA